MYTCQGWRKQFHIGQANPSSMDIYIYIYMATCVKRLPTGFREPGVQMYKFYCAKHNQHVKHINTRGVWGHAPPRKFLKNKCSEIEFGSISGS